MKKYRTPLQGFTLVELMATLTIISFLTVGVILKYPSTTTKLKVTNLVADLSGDLREAQLKASSVDTLGQSSAGFGVHFSKDTTSGYIQFSDRITSRQVNGIFLGDLLYTESVEDVKTVKIADGYRINNKCVSNISPKRPFDYCTKASSFDTLTITYERPNPTPFIFIDSATSTKYAAACIDIIANKIAPEINATSSLGFVRNIIVTSTGLITGSLGSCAIENAVKVHPSVTTYGATGASPRHIAVDSNGNVFTADKDSNSITKVTPSGKVSTFANFGTSPAPCEQPRALAVDTSDNIYVSCSLSNNIYKVSAAGIARQYGTTGNSPSNIVFDSSGNLYVGNVSDNNVTKIDLSGVSSVYASVGNSPQGMVFDAFGSLYTANFSSNTISKIPFGGGVGTIVAWSTTGLGPTSLVMDTTTNTLYVANFTASTVTKIDSNGNPTLFASVNASPLSIVRDKRGNLYTASTVDGTVGKITTGGIVSTYTTIAPGVNLQHMIITGEDVIYVSNVSTNTVSKIVP